VNNQNVGGTTLAEAGVNSHNMEQEITLSQQIFFSPKLVNNFRLLLIPTLTFISLGTHNAGH
jgi:hypothetical protein